VSIRPGSTRATEPSSLPPLHLSRDHHRQLVAVRTKDDQWRRVLRGAYADATDLADPRSAALAAIAATHERITAPHWFSHESAALVWGLPVWRTPTLTHIRQFGTAGGERDRAIMRHGGEVDAHRLTVVGGLPVTDLELTALDCARSLDPLAGLVVVDAALRAGADREAMHETLARIPGRRGVARAREVVDLADEGSESPGETATRFVLLRDGLPRPQTQVRVVTRLGTFWSDLGWDEWRVLLEYDGRGKWSSPWKWCSASA
jgi:predicted transcriptional regulator of viral defense system